MTKTASKEEDVSRPSWDEYFMRVAHEVAKRSTCPRANVGAVVAKDNRILATGCNAAPRGLPHCLEVGCVIVNHHCVRAVHAEQDAIAQAALHGVALGGASIYVTYQPCIACAKIIINAGLKRVVYACDYPDELARTFLEQAGVELVRSACPRQRSTRQTER